METENDNDGVKAEIREIRMEWPDLAKEQPELQADLLVIESQAEENRGFYERAKMLLEEGKILMEETNGITEEARKEKMVYLLNGLGKYTAAGTVIIRQCVFSAMQSRFVIREKSFVQHFSMEIKDMCCIVLGNIKKQKSI